MRVEQIKLIKVQNSDYEFLYELLKKRDPRTNISHRAMPTYQNHVKFIKSKPYKDESIVYLENNTEFQLELYNKTNKVQKVEIWINGKCQSSSRKN